MLRRTFIQSAGTTPFATRVPDRVSTLDELSTIAETYFDAFGTLDKSERNEALTKCANQLCIPDEQTAIDPETVVQDIDRVNNHLRRVRFTVRILNEKNITHSIDESMVEDISDRATPVTRFLPLLGSYNNLQIAACSVGREPSDKDIRNFLYACFAFGLEVGLWYSRAPFKMAWRGTRFVANRTLLRYANYGCNGCIALVMSELHWALRAVPYNITSKREIEFIAAETARLAEFATKQGYEVDVKLSTAEIQDILGSNHSGGAGAPVAGRRSRSGNEWVLLMGCLLVLALIFHQN